MNSEIRLIHSIAEADREEWNRLTRGPFYSYEWFEYAEAVHPDEFTPYYFLCYRGDRLVGALPAFFPHSGNNSYENYLLGRFQFLPSLLRPLRRKPLVCFSPHAPSAVFSDNGFATDVLGELIRAFENQAHRDGMTETVFLCLKETERDLIGCLRERGYLQVYLNSVGMIQNRFRSFTEYFQSLPRSRRKSIKSDRIAFDRAGQRIEEVREQMPDIPKIFELIKIVDQKHPSVCRDFSPRALRLCFEKMMPYRTHYFVLSGEERIGVLTHFMKDDLMNIYGMGLHFDKGRRSRAYFNLLYYHPIQRMIENRARHLNFNQMAYKVKESRGCELIPQYMLVKPLKRKALVHPWTGLLDARYRKKFQIEYGRNQKRFEQS